MRALMLAGRDTRSFMSSGLGRCVLSAIGPWRGPRQHNSDVPLSVTLHAPLSIDLISSV
jgi:hypothetical protein